MSFQGKDNGQNLPAWVQKTVEKSRNGFNRVHDELKRMYNDSLQLVTVTRPEDKSRVDSVGTKSNGFVRKLVRFVGSFKETIHRYNRRAPIEFVSEPEPIYDTADSLEQPHVMTEVAANEHKKTRKNRKSEHRVPKNKLTSKSKKGPMPHSELLKSTVYVNDRVLEERVDGKIKDKDNVNNSGESGTLYAEIDDEDTSDEKSDTGDPIHQSLLDLRQSCISTQRQNQKSKPRNREEESYYALKTEKQSPKGDMYTTLTKEDNFYTELTKDNRRVSASIESQTETKDASNISRYSKMSRSLPALSNPPGKPTRHRREVVSDQKHDAPAKYKSKTVSYHEKEVKCNSAKTEQRNRCNNEVAVKEEADKAAEVRSLYEYTVEEVAECFKQCAFIGLAQTCLDEKLDGEYFRDITADDLKREPFHMNWFHINKLFKVFNGWRPKRSVSHE